MSDSSREKRNIFCATQTGAEETAELLLFWWLSQSLPSAVPLDHHLSLSALQTLKFGGCLFS